MATPEAPKFDVGIEWPLPPVDLVMGSDSDAAKVLKTGDFLDTFGVPWEHQIISAHRTPAELDIYANAVRLREEELVIVCFAGMAAALGGDMAARVPNPVIGVPLISASDTMDASTAAQLMMPPGSGLTIVNPDGFVNAGLAALRSLSNGHPEVKEQLIRYQAAQAEKTIAANRDSHGEDGLQGFVKRKEEAQAKGA
jgi:5-(carboxyamino)imidazole ribonucleotide mutase